MISQNQGAVTYYCNMFLVASFILMILDFQIGRLQRNSWCTLRTSFNMTALMRWLILMPQTVLFLIWTKCCWITFFSLSEGGNCGLTGFKHCMCCVGQLSLGELVAFLDSLWRFSLSELLLIYEKTPKYSWKMELKYTSIFHKKILSCMTIFIRIFVLWTFWRPPCLHELQY